MANLPCFARLATQLEALPMLIGTATADALRRRTPSGRWSVHENLAHLGRQHEVFMERLRRILAEESPALSQYRAEEDPDWPAWTERPTEEVLRRLRELRAELIRQAEQLSPVHLERTGMHSRLGPMSLALWFEFFLVHEAHHLYLIIKRARGLE